MAALAAYRVDRTARMVGFVERHPERCVQIRCEDLVANPSLVLAGLFERLGVAATAPAAALCSPAGGTLRPLCARRSASPPPTTAGTSPPRRWPAFARTARRGLQGAGEGALSRERHPHSTAVSASIGAGARCHGSRSALWSDTAASCPGGHLASMPAVLRPGPGFGAQGGARSPPPCAQLCAHADPAWIESEGSRRWGRARRDWGAHDRSGLRSRRVVAPRARL